MCVCVCVSNIRVFVCISRNSGDIIKMEWSGFHFLFEKSLFFFLDRHALWCNRMLLHSPFFFFLFLSRVQAYYTNVLPIPFKHLHPSFLLEKKKPKNLRKRLRFTPIWFVLCRNKFLFYLFSVFFSPNYPKFTMWSNTSSIPTNSRLCAMSVPFSLNRLSQSFANPSP